MLFPTSAAMGTFTGLVIAALGRQGSRAAAPLYGGHDWPSGLGISLYSLPLRL